MIQEAIRKLREQQSKVRERSPQWMVAQQLMDLCRAEPACAEILAKDLEVEAMSITEAEKKIKAFADGHKTGGFACVTPMGFALAFPCLAFPWISGTGGALLCGCVWVHSGRAMPFFAI